MSLNRRLAEYRAELHSDFVPAIEAGRFVEMMEGSFPDELAEWMRTHAVRVCTAELTALLRAERRRASRRRGARTFAEAEAAGDVSVFATVYEIDPDHTRRPVAEMTGADHLYVAESYEVSGNRALMLAEFHRAVARRIGDQRTTDVLTETEYRRLYDSITSALV